MLYESTPNNIAAFMHAVGVAKKQQILKFFSDVPDAVQIEYMLDQLVKDRLLDYNESTEIYNWHTMAKINDSDKRLRILALWVIASFRSNQVREISLLLYPSQFLFVTHDNEVYDITVCHTKSEAALAARKLRMSRIEGVEDDINHIAVVNSDALGVEIGAYGIFDSYCILDKAHKPRYGTWN